MKQPPHKSKGSSKSFKQRVFQLLNVSKHRGDAAWWFDFALITLILLNVVAIILESIPSLHQAFHPYFKSFETFSVIVFSIEYIFRVWSANVDHKYKRPFVGNLVFALSPLMIADLLAIVPFYLPFLGIDLIFLRILRLFRIFRVFKIARYSKALNHLNQVFKEKREELGITFIAIFFIFLISSCLLYYVEHTSQPDQFSSIPASMWWAVSTLTTVGYGDIYPITVIGKILGGIIAFLGIGLFALPAGILASGFADHFGRKSKAITHCPHCGKSIP